MLLVNAVEKLRKKCVGTSTQIIEHTLYKPSQERNTVPGIGWNTPYRNRQWHPCPDWGSIGMKKKYMPTRAAYHPYIEKHSKLNIGDDLVTEKNKNNPNREHGWFYYNGWVRLETLQP